MDKILLIIEREYVTRVRKKTFIIMSIVGPILIAAIYTIPILLTFFGGEEKTIEILDESGYFKGKFVSDEKLKFNYLQLSLDEAKTDFKAKKNTDALVYIPKIDLEKPEGIMMFSDKGISSTLQRSIERTIRNEVENIRLVQSGINREILDQIKTNVDIQTISFSDEGEKSSSTVTSTIVGIASGFMIYFFTFLYGVQVLRGVIEEKTNRIVEVIISSVKPFQLMLGKVIGIAGVGLTQILIWIVLGFIILSIASSVLAPDMLANAQAGKPAGMVAAETVTDQLDSEEAQQMLKENTGINNRFANLKQNLDTINFPLIIFGFIFYFLFGYLMFASLFGAVGAAVDSETDTQQFMLPITMPLIIAMMMSGAVINDPNGSIAFWFSMFPLTSPIIMMIRLPFIGLSWELFLSMGLLILGFLGAVWLAARIYRVGILLYGKKPTYKELSKWVFYKF